KLDDDDLFADPSPELLEVELDGSLTVAGQHLEGDFILRREIRAGQPVVLIEANDVGLTLGDPATPFVSFTGASGQMVLSQQGLATSISVPNATLNVPGTNLSGTFAVNVQINTTTSAV